MTCWFLFKTSVEISSTRYYLYTTLILSYSSNKSFIGWQNLIYSKYLTLAHSSPVPAIPFLLYSACLTDDSLSAYAVVHMLLSHLWENMSYMPLYMYPRCTVIHRVKGWAISFRKVNSCFWFTTLWKAWLRVTIN